MMMMMMMISKSNAFLILHAKESEGNGLKNFWHKGDFNPAFQRRRTKIIMDAGMEVGMGSKSTEN